MGRSSGHTEPEPAGLNLLEDHDAAPEISQLLNYGQQQDELPPRDPAEHLRIARLSVIQTIGLSLLIVLLCLAAVYFAVHASRLAKVEQSASAQQPAASQPRGPAVQAPSLPSVPTAILPVTSPPAHGIEPGCCSIEQALQGPAADYISWHFTDPQLRFNPPLERAFETTILVQAEVWSGVPGDRLLALTDTGVLRWEILEPRGESFNCFGGSRLYAVVNCGSKLQGYDGWGKLAWEKEFQTAFKGRILSSASCFLYATGCDGYLYCLAPHGDLNWKYELGGNPNYTIDPLVEGGVLAVGGDGRLVRLDSHGQQLWEKDLALGATPVRGADNCIFAGSGERGLLYKLSESGDVIWQVETPSRGTLFTGGMLPLEDGGVIVSYDYPSCLRYAADGSARKLCSYPGVSAKPYRLDSQRFVIPTRSGELKVYDLNGDLDYSLALDMFDRDNYLLDPGGRLYMIAGRQQVVAIKPLP